VLIDYFTTIAQIINFLVLAFLLRHFLYRPLIKSMNEREQRIASRLKDAEDKRKEAQQAEESILKMKQDVASRMEEMIARAAEEAEVYRADLIEKAHAEVDRDKADWYEALERQKDAVLEDMRLKAGKEVYAISRRALEDLADEDLEHRMIATFLSRLESMNAADKEKLEKFYKKTGQGIIIKSAFEIPEDMRRRIEDAVRLKIGEMKIRYERAPDLVSGIELYTNDLKIAWSIEGYLDDLVADLSRTFEQLHSEDKAV
jgi:F-type H+-transporting ATPase subunit b